ncbi:mastermind-like protein 1 [Erinaceus europaeus]|uniref:Mastermind-like protein 1 n=1 Tax=Erinaceus europaeus TaxID=9365 RepID=A0ABM3XWW1_ERIEU|nr:mastermind-like protein 1 [Erinaceus europaeus]
MVLPTCPMAEFALPRHSAVMERLRRRIELCRRHHSTCEARYEAVSPERLELERQHTFALHQRCIQAKAKRAGKHRQPPAPTAAPAPTPAPVPAPAPAAAPRLDAADGPEHGRPVALLHDTVKRNLDSATSPQNGDQQNGYGDLFAGHKKTRREAPLGVAVSSNGLPPASPLGQPDKPGAEVLQASGKHSLGLDSLTKKCLVDANLHLNGGSNPGEPFALSLSKELKQEPVDDLPCMIAGAGGSISQSNLMPDLNLNEQEWKELIEELNRSVPDEDMKDLFTEDFEEKKDSEPPGSATQTPLAQDINIKTEFSPAAFEQEQLGSPQVRAGSAGQTFMGPSSGSASTDSPTLGGTQPLFLTSGQPRADAPSPSLMPASAQAQNTQRVLSSVVLPSQGPGGAELSSAHQLQQIAAKQKREQMLQNPQQAPPAAAPGPLSTWQPTGPSHSPINVSYSMEKPASPPGYKQDFTSSKLLMMPGVNKSSPRPGGPYLQPSHVNLLTHQPPSNLNQSSVPNQGSVLDYGNTKPLSHYKADCGQGGPGTGQNKTALMAYLPQQLPHLSNEQNPLFLMKPKPGTMPFRPGLVQPSQEQNPPSIPVPAQAPSVGTQPPAASAASTHSSTPYLSSQQQAAVMKQHQLLLDQQKQREQQQKHLQQQQQQFLQRQQHLLAEQEKQQFQRHLTRPPPQYQDPAQSTFPQQVGQFTGSSAAVPGMNSLGPSNPSCPRVFSQPGNLMPMGPGHTSVSSLPSNSGQQDRAVAQFSSSQSLPQSSLYGMASGMSHMVTQPPPQATNGHAHLPRQPGVGQNTSVSAAYGQNSLGSSGLPQQHSKGTLNSALTKPQVSRVSAAMGGQNSSWQHQGMPGLSGQAPGNGTGSPFTAASSFHMQQAHLKMSSPQFSQAMPSRPLAPLSSAAAAGSMLPPVSAQQRTSAPTPAPPQGAPQQGLPALTPAGPELGAFSQSPTPPMGGRAGLHCAQAYPVRTTSQELPFAYSGQPGSSGLSSMAGDTDLIDSLLKNRTSEEWMSDLDDLLGPQ